MNTLLFLKYIGFSPKSSVYILVALDISSFLISLRLMSNYKEKRRLSSCYDSFSACGMYFEHKYLNEASFIDTNLTRFYDLSGNRNHLIYGAYDWFDSDRMWVEGVNSYALNFSLYSLAYGAFYSVDSITGKINLTRSLTYEAWIKLMDFLDLRTAITEGTW